MPIIEPLNTIQGIQEAIKQDEKLRYDPLLSKKYLSLGGTLSNNAIPLPQQTKEPLAIFSRDGKQTVEDAKNKLAGFVPPTPPIPPVPETTEKTAPEKIPETKGGLTFDEAISLFGQDFTGLQQQPDGTYVPDKTALERLGVTTGAKTPEQIALEKTTTELSEIKTKMGSLLIPDSEVQRQIEVINQNFETRKAEMERANKSREAALTTTGLRLGSQYTGGLKGGVFGSIIAEEERQAISRISDLEAKKQEAILTAKQAQRDNNYKVLVQQADTLEKVYKEQIDVIKELNKKQIEENKRLKEEKEKLDEHIAKKQTQTQKIIEGLGRTVLNSLTGDEKTDASIIKGFAETYGVDANFLLNEVLKQDQEKTKKELTTREVGGNLYTYDPETQKWELAIKKPKEFGAGETGEINRDVESVMKGTLNLQDISVKDNYRAVVAGNLTKKFQEARKSGDVEGMMRSSAVYDKEPSDTFLTSMEKTISVLGQLGVLQDGLTNNTAEGLDSSGKKTMIKTGPIVGTFRSKNPWDTKAQTIKAQLNAIVPNLARGVYGEVGVLTDNDIKIYSKTIPNISSTKDVINAVLYITVDLIKRNVEIKIKNQAAGQRDMSGYAETYADIKNQANEILSKISKGSKNIIKAPDGQEIEIIEK